MKIKGIVIQGNKKAREIGFPTANIVNMLKIGTGIYSAKATLEGATYPAAAYVGAPQPDVLEVHFIDFAKDLYGKEIEVEVLEKIRDDVHETNVEKLKEMISRDIEKIKNLLYFADANKK
jgi:riboflavin kinase/FMN adenylyltransferase